MTIALEQEAAAHHVTLQQYITDILIARFMHQPAHPSPPEPAPPVAPDSAAASAEQWM